MCLHLTLPGSSAATVGYPKQEGRVEDHVPIVWKGLIQNTKFEKSRNC